MKYVIVPLLGLSVISLGASTEVVRKSFGGNYKTFLKTPRSKVASDYYADLGLFFYYDSQLRIEAIELAAPARPIFEGVSLLETSFSEACDVLKAKDPQVEMDDDGATSRRLGVSIYAPASADDPERQGESVLVFGERYFD